ncbi:hypothetical protein ANCCAN_27211 [Ancylostoma caninum]|uniref:Uncharacterized protein n=1 Tax=Ancylostoma caninum TaxID=29170 RepID=A0A368FA55_ANCCA|nr:hypothetical protein ANCCAN_27211 [Ancylostoma caninum]
MSARSVPTAGPAPTADIVRTYQHLGGYCIAVSGERKPYQPSVCGFICGSMKIPEIEMGNKDWHINPGEVTFSMARRSRSGTIV